MLNKIVEEIFEKNVEYRKETGWKFEQKKTTVDEIITKTKNLISEECEQKNIDVKISEIKIAVESFVEKIQSEEDKKLTKKDKSKFVDESEEALYNKISNYNLRIPLRVLRPEDTKELTLLVVKDFARKIITPIIAGSDKATRADYLKSNIIFSEFMYKILEELHEEGFQSDIDKVSQQILHYCLSSVHSKHFIVESFETFSFDLDQWKTSYLDTTLIDNADDNISSWESFRESIGDPEGWSLFCAWVYGIFDPTCIKKNRQALWMYGEGFDGKSSISKVLQYIISGEFGKIYGTMSMMYDQMEKTFWGSNIYGKSLTILSEVTDPNILSSKALGGKFHTWFGGDPAPIEEKGKGVFAAVLSSRCMLHANVSPVFDGHINQITRLIPIQIKKSYFKGLDYNGKSFDSNDWEQQLFNQRFSFLKFCRKCFIEKYNDQNLFSISEEYQENYFNLSEKASDLELICQTIEQGQDAYKPQDIKSYLMFVAKNYFKKDLYDRDIGTVYNKIGLKKTKSKDFGKNKIVKCKLNEEYLKAYNQDVENTYKGNELKIIRKIGEIETTVNFNRKNNKTEANEKIQSWVEKDNTTETEEF